MYLYLYIDIIEYIHLTILWFGNDFWYPGSSFITSRFLYNLFSKLLFPYGATNTLRPILSAYPYHI